MVDPEDGRIVDANKAAAFFYGYEPDQLLRMNIAEILYKSLLKDGYYTDLETTLRRKDGSVISVLSSSRIILLNEAGKSFHV